MATSPCNGNPVVSDAESIVGSVPMMEFTISHGNLFEDAMKVLKHFFTAWHESEVQLEQCKDGITNKLVLATHGPSGEKVLIRSYGRRSEVIIDRNQEIINLVRLSELGLSPPLYGRFHNGLIYGYIPGHVLAAEQMWDQKMQHLVAERLARWHHVSVPGKRVPKLFPTLDKWLKEVPKVYSRPELQEKFNEHFDVAVIAKEIDALRQNIEELEAPVVFCHNDLLSANILYREGDSHVSFIDYEYGSYNYRGFDIGNHFNEWAGFECDYSTYPSHETQLNWLRTYLRASLEKEPTEEDVAALYREVNKLALASHMYWGLWALVQAEMSNISFDYMNYAVLRFDAYYSFKAKFWEL